MCQCRFAAFFLLSFLLVFNYFFFPVYCFPALTFALVCSSSTLLGLLASRHCPAFFLIFLPSHERSQFPFFPSLPHVACLSPPSAVQLSLFLYTAASSSRIFLSKPHRLPPFSPQPKSKAFTKAYPFNKNPHIHHSNRSPTNKCFCRFEIFCYCLVPPISGDFYFSN